MWLVPAQLCSIPAPKVSLFTCLYASSSSFQPISPALSVILQLFSLSPHLGLFWLVLRAICSLLDNKRPSSEQVPSSIKGSPLPSLPGDLGEEKSVTRSHSSPACPSYKGFTVTQFTFPLTGISSLPSPSCFMPLPAFPHASQSLLPISFQVSLAESWGITSFIFLNHMLSYACFPQWDVPYYGGERRGFTWSLHSIGSRPRASIWGEGNIVCFLFVVVVFLK